MAVFHGKIPPFSRGAILRDVYSFAIFFYFLAGTVYGGVTSESALHMTSMLLRLRDGCIDGYRFVTDIKKRD